jgi:hypothetical protein
MNTERLMDLTRLSDLTVLTKTGHRRLELALTTKESPEPLSVKQLLAKVPSRIP